MKLGSNAGDGQQKRCRDAVKVTDSGIPPLNGMRKDHKKGNFENGPPLRPLANAGIGPNAALGNIMCRVLRPVREEVRDRHGTEVMNTEEILHKIEAFNDENGDKDIRVSIPRDCKNDGEIQGREWVCGSMDVAALFPSITAELSKKYRMEAFMESKLEFGGIDWEHVIKYASLNCDRKIFEKYKLSLKIPIPKGTTTLSSYINNRKDSQFKTKVNCENFRTYSSAISCVCWSRNSYGKSLL